jgi:hypothetical protein
VSNPEPELNTTRRRSGTTLGSQHQITPKPEKANHVRINLLRDGRAYGAAEPLLMKLVRSPKRIHQCSIGVAERVEPDASWYFDSQSTKQRTELPLK